uniref:Protein kinase domain-containing protein n=1 Tax=Panagrolaimus sp. PS1159 TaxID=55785 RepID=A0AC35F116_9BILA
MKACDFKIIKNLGEGTFSEVYLAENHSSQYPEHKLVALKRLKTDNLTEEEIMQCFDEIYLLQRVKNSENVIDCLGAFRESNDFFIALEFADKKDLEYLFNEKRQNGLLFSERSIWFYFHQICAGLKELHEQRILHRDLKPANIFLTRTGKAKIGDLGLSRIFSLKTQLAKTEVGTDYYLAPERNICFGGYNFKSDIWALGCILYEMCTLRSPFNGEQRNAYALFKRIEICQYPPVPANCYSRQLKFFISSCLSIRPENRPNAEQAHSAARKMNLKFESLRAKFKKQFGK